MNVISQNITIFERFADLIAPRLRERRLDAERRADIDALTGLANRAAFERAQKSADFDSNISFVVFDANHFGRVNKRCGHARGDRLLQEMAAAVGFVARKYNARAFRLGGDEFVILTTRKFAARVRDAVERKASPVDFGDFVVSLSGETGATFMEADGKLQARKTARKAAVYSEK